MTSYPITRMTAAPLYEELYCARGDMENRIKEQQLGSVRRPHQYRHHARQSIAVVVRFAGLCTDQ